MIKYKIHHHAPLFRILSLVLLIGGTLFCGVSVMLFMQYDDWNVRMFHILNTYFILITASIFFACVYRCAATIIKAEDGWLKIYYPLFLFRKIRISDITKLHILRYDEEHFSKYRRGTESRMRFEIYAGKKLVVLNDSASDKRFEKIPDSEVPLRRFYEELKGLADVNGKEE